MVTMELQIEENILNDAEKVLNTIGMDIQMAVNIFLRRIVLEKGLPMTMGGPSQTQAKIVDTDDSLNDEADYEFSLPRTNKAITKEMVEEVWKAFVKYQKGLGDIGRLSDDVAEESGMSRGSAFIYLNILSNLVKGEPNTRTLKMKDLNYFMEKIKSELGYETFDHALYSLKISIPYWRANLPGKFAEKVEAYCNAR